MKHAPFAFALISMFLAAAPSHAAPANARQISPPKFGVVREVTGATLRVMAPTKSCASSDAVADDGQCFPGLRPRAGEPQRVLVLNTIRAGDLISGQINRDYQLYDVSLGDKGVAAARRDFETSDVMVPRDCFALRDEPVKYTIASQNGEMRATETQLVVCGGGPQQPRGPYRAEGAPMPSDPRGWRRAEVTQITGAPRYLAVPDTACPQEFRIRDGHCARSAIGYLTANASVPEVDLVAAKRPVKAGDALSGEEMMQWVLKRRSNGFKADGRWVQKSMVSQAEGCTGLESLKWHVSGGDDGFSVTEKILSRCGAPNAPTPTAVYEVYGGDFFIINCTWIDGAKEVDERCRQQANDFLNRAGKQAGEFIIISDSVREGDRVHTGSYVRFTMVRAEMTPMDVTMKRITPPAITGVSGCSPARSGGDADGFMIVRSAGILWARRYQQMNCAVY
jgi:hypothetical protein